MNVGDIAKRVKRQFGDEAGAQITDDDIIRWINDAQRELAVANDLLQTTATTPLVAGQDNYPLPPDILTLRGVRVDGRRLEAISNDQASIWAPNLPGASRGMPTQYSLFALRIDLNPAPDKTGTMQVYYTRNPVPVGALTDTPELPQQYHNRLVEYCIAQAYELDADLEAYKVKMAQFTEGAGKLNGIDQIQSEAYPSISVSLADMGSGYEG